MESPLSIPRIFMPRSVSALSEIKPPRNGRLAGCLSSAVVTGVMFDASARKNSAMRSANS